MGDWRPLLSRALTGPSEAGRIYTLRWLGVLARIGAPSFAQYGVELVVEQLKDPSLQVGLFLDIELPVSYFFLLFLSFF